MKRLGFYMAAAALSFGLAGTAAIPAEASCRKIVIGQDIFSGGNSFSCEQPTNCFSYSQPTNSSCGNWQNMYSTIFSYCPSTPIINNNGTNNYTEDEEYFPGQRPGTNRPEQNRPGTDNKPEQNRPGTDNKPGQSTPDENNTADAYVQQVIALVNAERAKAGLSPLTESSAVSRAAAVRSKEIMQNFSHTRPDGTSFSTVLRQNGVSFSSSGENIAYGQRTPQEVMNTWMNSSSHRANILNRNFTTIGVGCYQSSSGTIYWTQLFTR